MITVVKKSHPSRPLAEHTVRNRFQKEHQADVYRMMPELIQIDMPNKEVSHTIVGYRRAKEKRLFSERYLNHPIEHVVSKKIGHAVPRDAIIEAGNLAGNCAGSARQAIILSSAYLYGTGHRWVVFTGIPQVINSFTRLGLKKGLTLLGEARSQCISHWERKRWGQYYAHNPVVMAGDIRTGYQSLHAVRKSWSPTLQQAFKEALIEGRHAKNHRPDSA